MFVSDLNEHHLNSVFKTSHLFLSYDLTFWLCFKCLQFGLKKSCEQQTSLLCHLRNDDQLSEWLRPQWVAPGFLLIFSLQYFFPVSSWILVCKPWGRGRKCIFIEVRSQTRCTEILDSISHFLQKQMAPKVWWVSPVCFFFFFFPLKQSAYSAQIAGLLCFSSIRWEQGFAHHVLPKPRSAPRSMLRRTVKQNH